NTEAITAAFSTNRHIRKLGRRWAEFLGRGWRCFCKETMKSREAQNCNQREPPNSKTFPLTLHNYRKLAGVLNFVVDNSWGWRDDKWS
ncbi:MAG: hypothetical protein ACK40X_00065, partial [Armatimonadota bacterium]